MRIETVTGLIYDSKDDRCHLHIQSLNHPMFKIAFVQCYDERTGMKDRFCGIYGRDVRMNAISEEESIKSIMEKGYSYEKLITFISDL